MSVAFSPDGKRIVSGDADGTVRLWDIVNNAVTSKQLEGPKNFVWSVEFSPNGERVVSGGADGTVRLWDIKKDTVDGPLEIPGGWILNDVAFSPDGRRIASGGDDGTVRLWDVERGTEVGGILKGHKGGVLSVAFSPNGRRIASGGDDGTVRLWDMTGGAAGGELLLKPSNKILITSAALRSDGKYIILGGRDGTVRLWDLESGKIVSDPSKNLKVHQLWVMSVAFHPDGKQFVSGSGDGTMRLWDVRNGTVIGEPLGGYQNGIRAVSFSLSGKNIASVDLNGIVQLWDLESRRIVRDPLKMQKGGLVGSVAFSPDRKLIVLGGQDGTVRLWNMENDTVLGESIEGHKGGVQSIAFNRDGTQIVSGGIDGTIQLWNARDGTTVGESPKIHEGRVRSVTFSPDGERIVSGGEDGMVRQWEVRNNSVKLVASKSTCVSDYMYWITHDVIVIGCDNRLIFYDSDLRHQGEMFLLSDGLVAIAAKRGVYASPPSNKDSVLTFQGSRNFGGAESIPISMVRQVLFNERTVWMIVRNQVEQIFLWIKEIHISLGHMAYPVWLFILWTLFVSLSLTIWVFFPSYLALWSMPKAGGSSLDKKLFLPKYVINSIMFLTYLGTTKRSLKRWLEKNRTLLEETCFTEHKSVIHRERYYPINIEDDIHSFKEDIEKNKRSLVWINGAGGSGKSALAMYISRKVLIGDLAAPIPVFVGEDWHGSLASQVAQQLRHLSWTRGPTEEMVKTLGACGLICPLVDSLSERGRARDVRDIVGSVKSAITDHDFRHLIVTSREIPPGDQIWQKMKQITPEPLKFKDIECFIKVYTDKKQSTNIKEIERKISPFLQGESLPSPLFLRFAIEQAITGSFDATESDPLDLILNYVEELFVGENIDESNMMRAAAIAAIQSIQESMIPKEFSQQQLESALTTEGNAIEFSNPEGDKLSPPQIIKVLIDSGLIIKGTKNLQFAHDSVAEYLAVWWVKKRDPRHSFNALKERIACCKNTEIRRIYDALR